MAQFLKKVLLFLVAFLVFEKVSYFLLIQAPASQNDNRMQMVMEGEVNKDVIVVGSSRGMRAVMASQIEDSTDLSAFNLCYVGTDLSFQEFILRTLVKYNDTPKAVMLVVDDPVELWEHIQYNFRPDLLVPYTQYHHITEELIKHDMRHPIARFVFTARISKRNFELEKPAVNRFDTMLACGSKPLSFYEGPQNYPKYEYNYDVANELEWKRKALNSIEQFCEQRGIQFILVYPPNYKVFSQTFVDRLKSLTGPKTLHYLYDRSNPEYEKTERFHDADHLHESGARIFTNELIAFLESLDL